MLIYGLNITIKSYFSSIHVINTNFKTPLKVVSSPERFAGITLKNFPKDADQAELVDLLIDAGLPEEKIELVKVCFNGTVTIRGLDNELSLDLIGFIHGKKYISKTIFCNGIVPMSPEKNSND